MKRPFDPVPAAAAAFLATVAAAAILGTPEHGRADSGNDRLFTAFQHPAREAKPCVFWVWQGNDAAPAEIVRQLDLLRDAGIVGADIMPIGRPTGGLPWLSAEWWRRMRFTADEAKQRGMTIDLASAYAWPSGGTFLRPKHRSQAISCVTEELVGPWQFEKKIDDFLAKNLVGQRSVAFVRLVPKKIDNLGQVVDLADKVQDGTLRFTVPPGEHVLYVGIHRAGAKLSGHSGRSDDFVLDHFNQEAVRAYLGHIAKTYGSAGGGRLGNAFHAFFVDSIEIWPSNWTTGFAAEFRRRRGYDLMPYAQFATGMYPIPYYQCIKMRPDLFTVSPELADAIRRVRFDYSKTLVELFHENFVEVVQAWCRGQGIRFRFQAYGYPWNIGIAENYMVPDIPEGNNWILNQGVADQDWQVWNKYAAAGGHLTGKHLISCEAMTTTKGKFHETLDLVKRADDFNFITGITRSVLVCYCYSPADAPPPGRHQYGTFFSEHNPWWPYLPRWTQYNARLSQVMQLSDPVVDVAILCPTADTWSDFGLNRQALQTRPRWGYKLWECLSQQGLSADYLHEHVIQKARFDDGRLIYGPMSYKLLVLCDVQSLEPETAEAIERYVAAGGKLVIVGQQPSRSPSLAEAAARDRRVKAALEAAISTGSRLVTRLAAPTAETDLLAWTGDLLERTEIARRVRLSSPSPKLFQVQYRAGQRDILFFCNQSAADRVASDATFAVGQKTPWRWDPETGTRLIYPCDKSGRFRIDLGPSESLLLVFEPDSVYTKSSTMSPVEY